ncbi:probable palmitoyltransferase ZDHHC4 isoform X2 [Argonauta hians]
MPFTMEFLTLFIGYLLIFSCITVVCICGEHPSCINGPLGWMRNTISKALLFFIPQVVVDWSARIFHYVYFQRNPTMQITFGTLVLCGHAIVVIDIFPILYGIYHDDNHVFVPMLLLFLNLLAFYKLCNADPGEITQNNHSLFISIYAFDGILYKKKTICKTCNFVKPARSKHCSICNRCVHRFDHHCVWTNNCIGALNNHYFIAFLLTLIMMCLNGFYMAFRSIVAVAHYSGMVHAMVMESDGKIIPVSLSALAQHLFMQFPRIIFLMASLSVLSLLIAGFTLYHIYLMSTNQTNNERHKLGALKIAENCPQNDCDSSSVTKLSKSKQKYTNPYDIGILKNIAQVCFPRYYIDRHKKIINKSK